MLTRHLTPGRAAAATAAAACALLVGLVAAPGASAAGSGGGGGGNCNVVTGVCTVGASSPPSSGGGGGGGGGTGNKGGGTCSYQGTKVPCSIAGYGSWDGVACYDELDNPQPPASASAWAGHNPADGGAIYWEYCPYTAGDNGQVYFLAYFATSPPGQPAQESPGQIAADMIKKLKVYPVAIGTAPTAGGVGLVGLPVWVWTKSALRLPTLSVTVGAVTVTMQASIGHISWSEDGGAGHICADSSTAYQASYGLETPVCGFPAGFATDGSHTVTATAVWGVTWTSNIGIDQNVPILIDKLSTSTLTIDQAQALNTASQETP